jgi:DNA-binding FrmR family transcriptional regulator
MDNIKTQVLEEREKNNFTQKRGPRQVNTSAFKRLNIIIGQTKGVQRMIEEEKYCIDILTQISAVRAALNNVGKMILRRHIEHCVTNAMVNDGFQNKEVIDELMDVFSKEEI